MQEEAQIASGAFAQALIRTGLHLSAPRPPSGIRSLSAAKPVSVSGVHSGLSGRTASTGLSEKILSTSLAVLLLLRLSA